MQNEKESSGCYEPNYDKELYGYYEVHENENNPTASNTALFLKKHFIGLILITLLAIFTLIIVFPAVTVTIKAGQRGVLYKRIWPSGVDLTHTYKEGLHFILPWNILTPYNTRIQETYDTTTVLTLQGMEMKLEISIRYQPKIDELPYLHEELGPDYARTVIIPQVKGVTLAILGNQDVEHIYTNIYQLIKQANLQVKKDLEAKHIVIDQLVIKSIELPKMVRMAVNDKIKQRQVALSYEYRLQSATQEALRKEKEAQGIKAFQSIVSSGISENYLRWKGIDATLKLAQSPNSKVVVIGSSKDGLPLILNTDSSNKTLRKDENRTVLQEIETKRK